ncbi:cytochrome c maturation protein CcmE [Microtetraspora niveoalba]|uniref:cytochrome c maturation protein CcmE n=1 Tax=Microtetraspora niveoalba TaxID=46175 RepID=UPI000B102ABB|nr:cytochrome c maturation protein CcmE [Microtetraspora niveoalba]
MTAGSSRPSPGLSPGLSPGSPESSGPSGPSSGRVRSRLPLLLVAAAGVVLACLAVSGLGDGLVYYRTPSEIAGSPADTGPRTRVGGLVVPGSVHDEGGVLRFRLSDGAAVLRVAYRGERPAIFREGQGAVVEGVAGADGLFHSDRLMVKHSNEYRAEAATP